MSVKRELTVIRFQIVVVIKIHCTGMSMEGDWGCKGEWKAGKERPGSGIPKVALARVTSVLVHFLSQVRSLHFKGLCHRF